MQSFEEARRVSQYVGSGAEGCKFGSVRERAVKYGITLDVDDRGDHVGALSKKFAQPAQIGLPSNRLFMAWTRNLRQNPGELLSKISLAANVGLVFRWYWSGFYDFLYFFSRSFSRFKSPATNSPDGIPGTMADLPRNIPSAMTDFSGHIAGRVTDCSASFFNLCAAIRETTGKNKYKNNGGGLEILVSLHADSIPHPGLTRGPDSTLYSQILSLPIHGKALIFNVLRSLVAAPALRRPCRVSKCAGTPRVEKAAR